MGAASDRALSNGSKAGLSLSGVRKSLPLGFRSGQLVVVGEDSRVLPRQSTSAEPTTHVFALCERCGMRGWLPAYKLRAGQKSCGCAGSCVKPPRDITGLVSGDWKVVQRVHGARWLVRCSAGHERMAVGGHLMRGNVRRCSTCQSERRNQKTSEFPIGTVIAEWTVMRPVSGQPSLHCRCSCGSTKDLSVVLLRGLKRGTAVAPKSCGCLQVRAVKARAYLYTVYGQEMTAEQIAKAFGVPRKAFMERLARGWSVEDAAILKTRKKSYLSAEATRDIITAAGSDNDLAMKHSITRTAVRTIRRKAGIPPAHPEKRNKNSRVA